MQLANCQPFFAWDALEDNPSLGASKRLLAAIPDAPLLDSLRQARGHGRDDHPVGVLWGVVLLTVVLRHTHCCNTAGDASALNARRNKKRAAAAATSTEPTNAAQTKAEAASTPPPATPTATTPPAQTGEDQPALQDKVVLDPFGLPLAAGGRKEYTDADGKVVKVVEWFGYKFHLLVDVKHEVTLAYLISSTKMGDNEVLPDLLQQAQANLPADRIKTLAYDKAADDDAVHELLHDAGIEPLIQHRHLWKTEPERCSPDTMVPPTSSTMRPERCTAMTR